MTRTLFWVGLVAAALAAAWFVVVINPFSSELRFEAKHPWVIGNEEDPFAYAGDILHPVDGTVLLRMDQKSASGLLEVKLRPDGALLPWLNADSPNQSLMLRIRFAQADENWRDRTVHGNSEVGESRLPEIHAQLAGSGSFEIFLDGKRQPTRWRGFWCLGDAIRQSDGSIRDQGLVFSPLLRDRSGFTDPERLELTLLIYESQETGKVVLHLAFPEVLEIAD